LKAGGTETQEKFRGPPETMAEAIGEVRDECIKRNKADLIEKIPERTEEIEEYCLRESKNSTQRKANTLFSNSMASVATSLGFVVMANVGAGVIDRMSAESLSCTLNKMAILGPGILVSGYFFIKGIVEFVRWKKYKKENNMQ